MRKAVMNAGARRGLAVRTRETYAGWLGRYGDWVGSTRQAMNPEHDRRSVRCHKEEGLSGVIRKKVEPPREERRQGKKVVERVHSERCRDADILSGVACGA